MIGGTGRAIVRTLGFLRKELAEALHQPRLVLLLVLGPFAILAVFGLGISNQDPPIRVAFVVDAADPLVVQIETFAEALEDPFVFDGVADDEDAARRRLRDGELDLVVVFPPGVLESLEGGEPAQVRALHDELDPVEVLTVRFYTRVATDLLNRAVVASVIEEARDLAGEELTEQAADVAAEEAGTAAALVETALRTLDPELAVAPFSGVAQPVTDASADLADFYSPAVLVLLVQHLLVSIAGLSLVREEAQGTAELYRVAPVRAGEVLLGKLLAYVVLAGVAAAALAALLVYGLGTPVLAGWAAVVVALALSLAASLGVALVLALLARTDSQAVQYGMLLLLASVFWSGLLITSDRFLPFLRWIAAALPATHGVTLLREVMLRGTFDRGPAVVLGAFGLVGTVLAWWGLRRRLRRR